MLVHDKSVPNTFLQMMGKFRGPWWLSAIKRSINLISEEELQPEKLNSKLNSKSNSKLNSKLNLRKRKVAAPEDPFA